MSRKWEAEACANIALIKYMGKSEGNVPLNPSLSYSLDHLRTSVELELSDRDSWEPQSSGLKLDRVEIERFLSHLERVRSAFGTDQKFIVRSGNNFPASCGLASSASSFAALTMAVGKALGEITGEPKHLSELAELSRQGSGSSCRSFWHPFSVWDEQGSRAAEIPCSQLHHQVVVLHATKKEVSSSEAHVRVLTSLLYHDRPRRAKVRLTDLLAAFRADDWRKAFEVVWNEFMDMHALFETSRAPFGYMTEQSWVVLTRLRHYWDRSGDGPLVTMDAGPNVHLLWRPDQIDAAQSFQAAGLSEFKVISSKA